MKQSLAEVNTQVDAVVFFLQRMNADMINEILVSGRTYQDYPKSVFMHKLSVALETFVQKGDSFLKAYPGICGQKGCHYGCKGISFVGDKTANYMDLIINTQNGEIKDIYECSDFITDQKVKRGVSVRIDNLEDLLPPF